MPGKEVAKVEAQPTAVVDQALAELYQKEAGEGFQDLKPEDYALPFLKILQGLSPEVQPGGEAFVEGAQQGDFLNSVTGELFKGAKGVILVRVAQETKWIEWKPRKAGGGLVRISSSKEEAEKFKTPSIGNPDTDTEILDTIQIYCLVQSSTALEWTPIVFSWARSKAKHARKWAAKAAQVTTTSLGLPGPTKQMPIYGVVYKVTTKMEKNAKGTFYVPETEAISPVMGVDLLNQAKAFRNAVMAGGVKVKLEKDDDQAAEDVPGSEEAIGV